MTRRLKPKCRCGATFSAKRANAGYTLCKDCGTADAIHQRRYWCVAPINKSNPMLITDLTLLKQLNPKRT